MLGLPCRHAVLRQDEAAGQMLGLLLGLDAMKVLLTVEPVPVQAPAPDGRGPAKTTLHSPDSCPCCPGEPCCLLNWQET